jgi:Ca2+-binding EF-hand superfamily protein
MEIMKKTGLTLLLICAGCLPTSIVHAQAKPAKVPAAPVQGATPPSAPPTLTRVSFIQLMDSEFKARDTDGDGKVSRAEITEFERGTALQKALLDNAASFARLDVDKDGSLSPIEFQALAANPTLPDITSIMQRFDKNRDQQITIVEYRIATLVRFDDLDADKDGAVDQAELRASQNRQNSIEPAR